MPSGPSDPGIAPLLAPFSVRGLTLANRFVMSPMTRNFCPSGVPGDDVAGYYRRRAEGGVGLIVTEGIGVDHPAATGSAGLGETAIPRLDGDHAVAAWRRVVDGVHAAGGRIAAQLWHQGPMRLAGTGAHPAAPSLRPSGLWGPIGHCTIPRADAERLAVPTQAMTEGEIGEAIEAYLRSAAMALAAGFDAIALHGGHGYLLDAFLWSGTNARDDDWGGDPARRARFPAEIVRGVRALAGPDVPILFRWSQWKQQDYAARLAHSPDELEAVLAPLVEAGCDIFDCSARRAGEPAFDGSDLSLAGWTRRVTGCPTIAVGGVGLSGGLYDAAPDTAIAPDTDLSALVARFEAGEFDLLGIGRALLQDPNWLAKLEAGMPTEPFHRANALPYLS